MSERPTQAENDATTCKVCGGPPCSYLGQGKFGCLRDIKQEANSTHAQETELLSNIKQLKSTPAQEAEEQEVLKLADDIGTKYESGWDGWEFRRADLFKFSSKLREKYAETIAGLQAAARFWQDKAGEANSAIADLQVAKGQYQGACDVIKQLEETIVQQKEVISNFEKKENIWIDTEKQLSATQAREAMLVEALTLILASSKADPNVATNSAGKWTTLNVRTENIVAAQQALSNSTEHTEKWMAEVKAKTLSEHKCWNCGRLQDRMTNEIRSK